MKQEAFDSATSYAVGGTGLTLAFLMDIATVAQALTMILGLLVVIIRLSYDVKKLYRSWRGEKPS